jgi:hypothetical protein
MTIVLDALTFRVNAGDAAGDRARIATEIKELTTFMETLLVLDLVDHHRLNISLTLIEANELKVALDQLRDILMWRSVRRHG